MGRDPYDPALREIALAAPAATLSVGNGAAQRSEPAASSSDLGPSSTGPGPVAPNPAQPPRPPGPVTALPWTTAALAIAALAMGVALSRRRRMEVERINPPAAEPRQWVSRGYGSDPVELPVEGQGTAMVDLVPPAWFRPLGPGRVHVRDAAGGVRINGAPAEAGDMFSVEGETVIAAGDHVLAVRRARGGVGSGPKRQRPGGDPNES
jgi:hypothetical protein